VANPPSLTDPLTQDAGKNLPTFGYGQTILTSGQGAGTPTTAKKQLLGG
jgi:hypothetical protein